MKSSTGLLLFAVLLVTRATISCAGADYSMPVPNPSGTPTPARVHEWVRLIKLGGHNSLAPVIWVSPYRFERVGIERMELLTRPDYLRFLHFVDTHRCPAPPHTPPPEESIEIAQFSKAQGFQVVCTLPPRKACDFLSAALQQSYFLSSISTVSDLRFLSKSVGC